MSLRSAKGRCARTSSRIPFARTAEPIVAAGDSGHSWMSLVGGFGLGDFGIALRWRPAGLPSTKPLLPILFPSGVGFVCLGRLPPRTEDFGGPRLLRV